MEKEQTKKCPFCAEEIKVEAIVCKFCGRTLLDADYKIKRATQQIRFRKKAWKQISFGCAFLVIGWIITSNAILSKGSQGAFMGGFFLFFIGFIIFLLLTIRAWWHTGR